MIDEPLPSVPRHGNEAQKGYGVPQSRFDRDECPHCEGEGHQDNGDFCQWCFGSGKAR